MNTQTVCRICKTEGIRLHCITSTHLQEMYERETHTCLTTEDVKPMLACIECCDRLQHCSQINGIEKTENTPTMMNPLQVGQMEPNTKKNGITVEVQKDNTCVVQKDIEISVKIEPLELSDVEVKEESTTDIENGTVQDNNIKVEADNQMSDTDHGSATRLIKIEPLNVNEDEANVSRKRQKNYETRNNAETSSVKVTLREFSRNELTLRSDVPELTLETKLNANLNSNATKLLHTAEKHFECEICKKCYTQKSTLVTHSRTHTGEKPYQCNVCEKSFNQRAHLTKHARTHTGEKPFTCTVCMKCFSGKSTLTKHSLTHTGEKPFECNICKKRYSQKSSLTLHTRTHTGEKPFACNVCNKRFSEKKTLIYHTYKHTGDKSFQCDLSGKCLFDKNALLRHTRIHTGEKPFKCDVCKKCFSQKVALSVHTRTQHF